MNNLSASKIGSSFAQRSRKAHLTFGTIFLALVGISAGYPLGAEEFSGNVQLGLRNVDVDGDKSKFKQHIQQDSGLRLLGLDLNYRPSSKTAYSPDEVNLSAYGLGGDPYQSVQLKAAKNKRYKFSFRHTQSDYFYQDLLFNPAEQNAEAVVVDDLHSFDYERITHRADLYVQLADQTSFKLTFDEYKKSGHSRTVLDIQREEFELEQPIDESSHNIDLEVTHTWKTITITLSERWKTLENDFSTFLASGVGDSEGSDPDSPTRLDLFFLGQPYQSDTREHQLNLATHLTKEWTIAANVLVADSNLDMRASERTLGTGFTGAPLNQALQGLGSADRDSQQYFISTDYSVTDNIHISASLREYTLDQDTSILFDGIGEQSDWKIKNDRLTLGIDARIANNWTLAAGWSRQTQNVDSQKAANFSNIEKRKNNGFWTKINYRPNRQLNFTLSVEDNSINDPFTSTSPTNTQRYRARVRFRHGEWRLMASHSRRFRDNDKAGWDFDSKQTDIHISHTSEHLTLQAGLSLVDLNHSIDQVVTGGFRQDLFAIDYDSDANFWNGTVRWHATSQLNLIAEYRNYQNKGSLKVSREDISTALQYALSQSFQLTLKYRHSDFSEEPMEAFNSDIWEIVLGYQW
ncbi:MAG: hypothetical protein KUG75_04125 [Pseudomonadales bacterium]|nr:hypothetical protein [Pseudomonadales bacterium]